MVNQKPENSAEGEVQTVPQGRNAIDYRDISVGDLLRGLARLKLSAAVSLFSAVIIALGTVYGWVAIPYESKLQEIESLDEDFVNRFADRDVLRALVPQIQEGEPDGLSTYEEVLGSLLWQVKSQRGFAEFLSGDRAFTMRVIFNDDNMEFKWDSSTNLLLQILSNLGYPPTSDRLMQLNAELNLLGVAWIDDSNYLVRGSDGGLHLIVS